VARDAEGEWTGQLGTCLARYTYDALGRRVMTHRNPGQPGQSITRHVYGTGAAVVAEYSVNPSTSEETALRWFVHGEGFPEPLAMVDVSAAGDNATPGVEEFLYYLTDVQGSVGALTNAVGQVVERYFYTPYGQTTITAADGTTPRTESLYGNPFAYTAQRYEPQTGLYHFWARVYSPTLGRFLQEDAQGVLVTASIALGYNGGAPDVTPPITGPTEEYPDLLNLYAYAMGNPLRFTDPLGLDIWDEWIDDEIADNTGHKIATLGFLNEAAQIALVGMNASVSIAGSLLGVDLFQSFANIYEGKGSFGDYLQAGLTVTGAGYGIYKAFKWGHKLAKASKAGRIVKANRARGLAFEEYGRRIIGIDKYRGDILAHNGRRFIPDGLTSTQLIEFKDVIRISLSPQLKAMGHWAKANGRKAILYVSDRTQYISGPVRELFEVIPLP